MRWLILGAALFLLGCSGEDVKTYDKSKAKGDQEFELQASWIPPFTPNIYRICDKSNGNLVYVGDYSGTGMVVIPGGCAK